MNRRKFLKGIGATAVAAAIPMTSDVGVFKHTGTVTGRLSGKALHYANLYGMRRGKSWATDIAAYKAALNGKRVFYVTGQKNAVIQMANADFRELEARVLEHFLGSKQMDFEVIERRAMLREWS